MTTLDSTTPTKVCTTCGKELPATTEYFHRHKRGKYGLRARCRDCQRIKATAYYVAHAEERRDYSRSYRRENPYSYDPVERAKFRATNHEKRLAYDKIWRDEHREQIRASQAAYSASPRGRERQKIAIENRRARKLGNGGSFTASDLKSVIAAHTNTKTGKLICAFCGKPIKGAYHIDHWIPLRHGGRNDAGNLRVMHPKCNQKKSAKHPHKLGRLL